MQKLVKDDIRILVLLFPVFLFVSNDKTIAQNSRISMHELRFLKLLQEYLFHQSNEDHGLTAVRLGMANELASDLQDL